ncbi:hypothetical protein [Sphingomonas gellani]|nr:hypothetical protein [Sphingomonas gellani]
MGLLLAAVPMRADAGAVMPQGTPSPLWRGATRIALSCTTDVDSSLCDILQQQARALSALPVDPASGREGATVADRGVVVLTVSIEDIGDARRLAAVARRAVEIDDAESPARHAVPWPVTKGEAGREAAERLLAGILPHRSATSRSIAPAMSQGTP